MPNSGPNEERKDVLGKKLYLLLWAVRLVQLDQGHIEDFFRLHSADIALPEVNIDQRIRVRIFGHNAFGKIRQILAPTEISANLQS
jgi:hypothetical protein